MPRRRYCFAIILAGLAGSAAAADDDPVSVAKAAAEKALAKPGAAGLSIAIARHGSVLVAKGFGFRNMSGHLPVEESTLFHACSTSKQFAAAAVLRLCERGAISLDDPVIKHLPEFHAQDRPLNLRHLLNHTSGLPTYDQLPAFAGENELRDVPHAQIIQMFQDEPCKFAPGAVFAYTNSGYFLAGEIIERVSGQSWGEFVRTEFRAPLGLNDTLYDPHPSQDIDDRIAIGYTNQDGKTVEAKRIAWGNASCAGGNLSSARNLVLWTVALSSGKVISPASYALMTAPVVWPDGDSSGYGLGLWVDPASSAGPGRIWHTGHGDGYTAAVANYSQDELVIAVMSNSDTVESMGVVEAIAAGILHTPELKTEDRMLPPDRLGEFTGTYEQPRSHSSVKIAEHDGHLTASPQGFPTFTLLWQGEDRFVLREAPKVEIRFVRADESRGMKSAGYSALVRTFGGVRETAVRKD